ncbi:MAG: hypothetical protein GVY36_02635 [Verrucomicrobia bacterium]|jgi:asparagine synthase (glutamine-hydrolysing)|nr:hypothetical protein [Verrucomicrobiota bacterium]
MTAIAGIVQPLDTRVQRPTLDRITSSLSPYGPDSQSQWTGSGIAAIRTLLRITPEDRLDRQPLYDREAGVVLLFDGRLDNRVDLASQIGISSRALALMSDADVVMQACKHWGKRAVARLLGDFAMALFEPREGRVWLARDYLGYRPLFWHKGDGFFAFASLPRALFAIPGIHKQIDKTRVHDFLCLFPAEGGRSFFKDIQRVQPGQIVEYQAGTVKSWAYYEFDLDKRIEFKRDDDYVEAFQEHLDCAVSCRLRSLGSIATHLSSGFDSSTITATAARLLSNREKTLLAYTSLPREGWDGPVPRGRHGNEWPGASAVARRFSNIEHKVVRSSHTTPIEQLEEHIQREERAPLNPCNYGWDYAIDEDAARNGAKVVLKAGMGNLTISYDGIAFIPELLRRGKLVAFCRALAELKGNKPNMSWRAILNFSVAPFLPLWAWRKLEARRGRLTGPARIASLRTDLPASIDSYERARQLGWDWSYRPPHDGRKMRVSSLTRLDNGEVYLGKNALGLEHRDPTADRRLVEFCLAIPERQYWNPGNSKWLIRRAMASTLPAEILQCKTRGLQSPDWYEATEKALPMIRQELAALRNHPEAAELLDLDALERALDGWPGSDGADWGDPELTLIYRTQLLRSLSVGRFVRYAEDSNT